MQALSQATEYIGCWLSVLSLEGGVRQALEGVLLLNADHPPPAHSGLGSATLLSGLNDSRLLQVKVILT